MNVFSNEDLIYEYGIDTMNIINHFDLYCSAAPGEQSGGGVVPVISIKAGSYNEAVLFIAKNGETQYDFQSFRI